MKPLHECTSNVTRFERALFLLCSASEAAYDRITANPDDLKAIETLKNIVPAAIKLQADYGNLSEVVNAAPLFDYEPSDYQAIDEATVNQLIRNYTDATA